MSPVVLALVLAAAVAHASWNLLAKGAAGGAAFVWLTTVASALIYLPVLVLVPIRVDATALGLMAASGALHAAYFVLLQRGYATGDLSLVYPLARGTGPLLSTTAAIVVPRGATEPRGAGGRAADRRRRLLADRPPARGSARARDPVRRAHGRDDGDVHAARQARGRPGRAVPDHLLLGHQPRQRRAR